MSKEVIIKRSVFGGFDRKQVIEYINYLRENSTDNQSREQIDNAKTKIADLTRILEEKNKEILRLQNTINSNTQNKDGITKLSSILPNVENLDFDYSSDIQQASKEINESVQNADEEINPLFERLTAITDEVERLGANLSDLSGKFNNIPTDGNIYDNATDVFPDIPFQNSSAENLKNNMESDNSNGFHIDLSDNSNFISDSSSNPFGNAKNNVAQDNYATSNVAPERPRASSNFIDTGAPTTVNVRPTFGKESPISVPTPTPTPTQVPESKPTIKGQSLIKSAIEAVKSEEEKNNTNDISSSSERSPFAGIDDYDDVSSYLSPEKTDPFISNTSTPQTYEDPYMSRQTMPAQEPYIPRQTMPVQEPIMPRQAMPVQEPYMPRQTMPTQEPYMPRQTMPTQEPYMPRQTMPVQEPYIPRQTMPTQEPIMPRQTMPVQEPVMPRQTMPVQEPIMPRQTTPAQDFSLNIPVDNPANISSDEKMSEAQIRAIAEANVRAKIEARINKRKQQ